MAKFNYDMFLKNALEIRKGSTFLNSNKNSHHRSIQKQLFSHFAKNHELSRGKCPPSNLIVDTTFSSLFGSTPGGGDNSTTNLVDQTRIQMNTPEGREQFLRNSFKKRGTLRADEQDIHTIRTPDHEPMLAKHDTYNSNDVRLSSIHSDLAYRFDHPHNNSNSRNDRPSLQPEPLHLSDQRNLRTVSKLKSQVISCRFKEEKYGSPCKLFYL